VRGFVHEFELHLSFCVFEASKIEAHTAENPMSHIQRLQNELTQLHNLCKDLGVFAPDRKRGVEMENVPLTELVGLTINSYSRDFLGNVKFELALAQILIVRGYPSLLGIAIFNIIINAVAAMHGRGVIKATVELVDGRPTVSFEDNGPGMDQETLRRCIEPYYTSRQGGKGLGLFAVHEIMAYHHGTVRVESQLGVGTKVTLEFQVQEPKDHAHTCR
jgi:signal transduction histidine kinase